ncbi:hypothetical protein C808_00648 [Lachnospiraceae bacterium M18-1]|nr:hypothetical protein C808_00648 [Lachnospiraceae bacterium M18-1]
MGIRYRKSIKIAPGVKINLNKKSASVTFGGKGYHKTFNSNGQTTTSVNLPVKGMSYTDRKGKKSKSTSAPATHYRNIGSVVEAPAPKEKKITAKAILPDPPTMGVAVIGFFIIVAGFSISESSIPAGIIVALFGAYRIYAYIAHKRNPDSGKYISEGQLTRWRQLLSVSSGTSSELIEKSLPVLLNFKAAAEEYCSQLPESAEALLNTQQKILDFSEFVIIKGDNPQKDYERYSALIAESQK